MASASKDCRLAFVWRACEMNPSVLEAAQQTGCPAIFDLTAVPVGEMLRQNPDAGVRQKITDIKLTPSQLFDPQLTRLVSASAIERIWFELNPFLGDPEPSKLLNAVFELDLAPLFCPIVAQIDLIRALVENGRRIPTLALKGSEASGYVGSESTLTLYSIAGKILHPLEHPPEIAIWGGIGTPQAAATFLATGTQTIVFESLHWLTSLVPIAAAARTRISKLHIDHSEIVGLNLQVPYRLFNRGNSRAVKRLQRFSGSLCGREIRHEQQRLFAERIQKESTHALDSRFGPDELVLLGTEAAFAAAFAARFGTEFCSAVAGFKTAVETHCQTAAQAAMAFNDSPVAAELGTRYPFIQGAMTWITDVPDFARAVAEAGALPTIALGTMSGAEIRRKLAGLKPTMQNRLFAVNVVCLPENPFLNEQLEWVKQTRPRFAVIAAGEPQQATALLRAGIEVIYIAGGAETIKMAFNQGIRYVVCEGNEAGGHIGTHSTLSFAQVIEDLRQREPALFAGRRIILAGGIFNRQTAFMAAMLGADALQLGTAYLASAEIVETGALTRLYQRLIIDAKPGSTLVSGECTGLRVRSLNTPKMNAICSLERDYIAGSPDEITLRRQIEALSTGSLLVAARGIDGPAGRPLAESDCLQRGQFMSGACSGLIDRVRTVAQIHRDLATAPLPAGWPLVNPFNNPPFNRRPGRMDATARNRSSHRERIAITGMSAVNALGNTPEAIWAASKAGASGIVAVPAARWDHSRFYDPRPQSPEKTYCKVAAFQHLEITRKELGISPHDFRTMTDSTKATLWLTRRALEDSGLLDAGIARERIGVFISQNSGEAAGTLQDVIIRGSVDKIIAAVKEVVPIPPDLQPEVAAAIKSRYLAVDDTTLLGRLNCTAAGFICNSYGFQGPSFAVSAACATSLVALYNACHLIRNGTLDAAIVGGAEELLTPLHFLEFSALGALAGLSGADRPPGKTSRPFDAGRDGMVLGEGGGVIIVEKESTARKRQARIHGYVTGMGASNNHLGLVESSRSTQALAIRASFNQAGYGPDEVDLVECHATATVQGDIEEIQALQMVFDSDHPTHLTSFKSQIGHTLGASGLNSLIRALMAAKEGILPATLNLEKIDPALGLDGSGLRLSAEPGDWRLPAHRPRRFQVNSFGFGGSNYVLQVEVPAADDNRGRLAAVHRTPAAQRRPDLPVPLPPGLSFYRTRLGGRWYRLAQVTDTGSTSWRQILADGWGPAEKMPLPERIRSLAAKGVFLGPEEAGALKMGFVFPGQGSFYAGMGDELYRNFPVVRQELERVAALADFDLLNVLFHLDEEKLQKTRWQQPALFALEYAIARYLISVGLRPAALAGHSLGELTALCIAGVFSYADGYRIVNRRAVCMEAVCDAHPDPGVMVATDAPLEDLQEYLRAHDRLYITNINAPRQVVFGGDSAACREFSCKLENRGFRCTRLKVSMAFHSPAMRIIHDELEAFISQITFHPPQIPVVSNTTCKPFPAGPAEIRRIVMAHLETPVRWMHNVRTLHSDYQIGLFVEVGPGRTLSDLIADTLDDAVCFQTCLSARECRTLKKSLAGLYAAGCLPAPQKPVTLQFPEPLKPAAGSTPFGPQAGARAAPRLDSDSRLNALVQREINNFVMDSFEPLLKPRLLAALQREYGRAYSEKDLDTLLDRLLPPQGAPSTAAGPSRAGRLRPASGNMIEPPTGADLAAGAVQQHGDAAILETVIRIIMDATGYERNEIEPGMDLRADLAIRSSRLPVIMDALENRFQISIEMASLAGVRTIGDLAERIAQLVGKPQKPPDIDARRTLPEVESDAKEEPLRRIVFRQVPLKVRDFKPLALDPLQEVVILAAGRQSPSVAKVAELLRRDYGVTSHCFSLFESADDFNIKVADACSRSGGSRLLSAIAEIDSPSGLIFIADDDLDARAGDPQETAGLAKFFFKVLKLWITSPDKKFALLLQFGQGARGLTGILREAVTGMFLSLAHEFPAALLRTVRLDELTPLRVALRGALNRSQSALELIYRDQKAYTHEGRQAPIVYKSPAGLPLRKGDVVVLTGGYGITPNLARAFTAEGCKIVLIGRTVLASEADLHPGSKSAAIRRTLTALENLGADVTYVSADVMDFGRVKTALEEIRRRFGPIAGIIHGAGILRDRAAEHMTDSDFAAVFDVKYLGAWHLYQAARGLGLKFFVCLSSGAAVLGNAGQVNYAAANRSMAALMSYIKTRDRSLWTKALMLPPIEGAGMAENSSIKAIFKRLGAGFIHINELAELFAREVYLAGNTDPWVMFMRRMPAVNGVRIKTAEVADSRRVIRAGPLSSARRQFPLIDRVRKIDLQRGELVAEKSFSADRDLWLADHRPFKFIDHPLVSGMMAVEAFIEAASILVPYLDVIGAKDVDFVDLVECPPGTVRAAEIVGRSLKVYRRQAVCEFVLNAAEIPSPTQRRSSFSLRYRARILLGRRDNLSGILPDGLPVGPQEIDSRPMDRNEILQNYHQRTDMGGRYQLMQEIEGTGDGLIRGRFICRRTIDFSGPRNTCYRFSPYILEAMLQAANFYVVMRNASEKRAMIPRRIGELHFLRNCTENETITVEARISRTDETGLIWNARAADAGGRTLMVAKEMQMSWFP